MALPLKKEVKEGGKEIPLVKEQSEKSLDFGVTPVLETSEIKIEQSSEAPTEVEVPQAAEKISEAVPKATPPSTVIVEPIVPPVVKDEITKEIENILAEDLTDIFLKMTPAQQEEFRIKGEETASKIRVLLTSAKVNVKKILVLIGDWLKIIPGINRFFLEQEAKIKTDKILLNTEEFKKEGKM